MQHEQRRHMRIRLTRYVTSRCRSFLQIISKNRPNTFNFAFALFIPPLNKRGLHLLCSFWTIAAHHPTIQIGTFFVAAGDVVLQARQEFPAIARPRLDGERLPEIVEARARRSARRASRRCRKTRACPCGSASDRRSGIVPALQPIISLPNHALKALT